MNPIRESRYILPFKTDDMAAYARRRFLKNPAQWEMIRPDTRYLENHVACLFGDGTAGKRDFCRIYALKAEARKLYGFPAENAEVTAEISVDGKETEKPGFFLKGIQVVCFMTGIGFLILNIAPEEKTCDGSFVNFNYAFTHLLRGSEMKNAASLSFLLKGKEKTDMIGAMKKLIGTDDESLGKHRPILMRDILYGFHILAGEDIAFWKDNVIAMIRAQRYDYRRETGKENDDEAFCYSPAPEVYWTGGLRGTAAVVQGGIGDESGYAEVLYRNAGQGYFALYLLALHEREAMLRFSLDMVEKGSHISEIIRLKEEMVRFNAVYSYKTVSEETNYQRYFHHLREAMRLEELKGDIREAIEMTEDFKETRRERKLNTILAFIAVLAVFSSLTDSLSLVEQLRGSGSFGWGHIAVLILNGLTVLIGVIAYTRRK